MPLLVRRTWENKQYVTDVSHTAYMFLDDVWVWRLQMSQHLTMKIRRLRELCVLHGLNLSRSSSRCRSSYAARRSCRGAVLRENTAQGCSGTLLKRGAPA